MWTSFFPCAKAFQVNVSLESSYASTGVNLVAPPGRLIVVYFQLFQILKLFVGVIRFLPGMGKFVLNVTNFEWNFII